MVFPPLAVQSHSTVDKLLKQAVLLMIVLKDDGWEIFFRLQHGVGRNEEVEELPPPAQGADTEIVGEIYFGDLHFQETMETSCMKAVC